MDQLASIEIFNTFGTEYVKFPVHSIVRIRGTNGSGKSSVLNAILKAVEGGKDPTIIRAGTAESRIILTTTEGYTITKRTWIKQKKNGQEDTGSELVILEPGGSTKVPEPATYLRRFAERGAVDPGALLRIDTTTAPGRRELAAMLMKIVPMDFEREAVENAITIESVKAKEGVVSNLTGEKWIGSRVVAKAVDLPPHTSANGVVSKIGLKEIRGLIRAITERRQRIGSAKEDAEGTITRQRAALPTTEVQDYTAALASAELAHDKILHDEAIKRVQITMAVETAIRGHMSEWHAAEQQIDNDFDERIRLLNLERASRKKEAQAKTDADIAQAEKQRIAFLEEAEAEFRPLREQKVAEIATLRAQAGGQERVKWTLQEIELATRAVLEHSYLWTQLGGAKSRLEALLQAKLDSLPVPGLEVSEDGASIDGIPWQNVNTARKVEISVQICALIAGELGFMILDDCEHLVPATLAALEKAIVDAGFQLIEAIADGECETIRIEQVAA